MTQQQVASIVKGIGAAVLVHVEKALGSFADRIAALEQRVADRASDPGPTAVDDARVVALEAQIKALQDEWGELKTASAQTMEAFEIPDPDLPMLVKSAVADAVAALPQPKDGRDGIDGKDGIGVMGVLIDREGQLVATLSDGTVKVCGVVVGRDGRDIELKDVEALIQEAVEALPKPKDGEPGAPGRDGTLEQLTFVQSEDFRTVTACFKDGTPIEGGRWTFPVVIDRGVFKEGTTYQAGDGVTWAGSFSIAQRETSSKPEGPDWRLAVRRGGTGKDGKPGKDGKDGAPGVPGRDGTKTW